ncbi:penicillin-binding transpeptidase domain-containing protein [Streptomyces sp. XD-27]|uniref:penicillin-binding transpeptidase domain-containing protein n=1 Tax=Streptomyces sp. XD-27 TaxID=3062779 RepID=UPI0026F473BA|nr:penicillin-binding transpeptidase domain-containing protein [Streptomyces sp. XD-27]WKX72580.1 penicillin-binding transpeptidase domain-containing protein [Streptomyces sp. XD-27]
MTRCVRHTAVFCLLLLLAPLVNAARIQAFKADQYDGNPANRRHTIARYGQPRGDILVGGVPVTGSTDTGQRLRYERTYREGPLYAPVTGYASQSYGTSLLEDAEDAVLSGTDRRLAMLPLWNDLTRARQPGGTVATTIDPAVQRAAFTALGRRRGAVAALEPGTGRILALVSTPSYEPGRLSGNGAATTRAWQRLTADPDRPMLNRALSRTYPPGSTFNVVTAAAGLEHGTATDVDARTAAPNPYHLPGTRLMVRDRPGVCAHASLRHALAASCDSVFAELGVRTGPAAMTATAERFGFNAAGLTVPSPVATSTFDRRMPPGRVGLSAIGHTGVAATPLQMAMVAAAVAGGGDVLRPHLVDRVADGDGATVAVTPHAIAHQPISRRTAAELRRMTVSAVTDGTGAPAAVPGATVGGTTGTAGAAGAAGGPSYAWFVGWAQKDGAPLPAAALAVVVEAPAADRETGGVTTPTATTAARVAGAALRAAVRGTRP